jgi:hypothetical protein
MEDKMTEQQREQIKRRLHEGEVVVTFTKVNGDKRVMTCTLQESVLPSAKKDDTMSQKKVREINPEVCSVWDVNANGWRAFRWENVVEIQ